MQVSPQTSRNRAGRLDAWRQARAVDLSLADLSSISSKGSSGENAFTLVEMLVVMVVIVVLISLTGPAINSLKSSGDVSKAVYDIAGILTQARTYAVSTGTYVYVGIEEVDASQSGSAVPQTAGTGRLGIAVIASRTGTRGYDVSHPKDSWSQLYTKGAKFQVIGKLQTFDNLHCVDLGQFPTSGSMSRPPLSDHSSDDPTLNLANPASLSVTPFSYPLGYDPGSGTYNFTSVIQFTPQGNARIQNADNSDVIPHRLEIGLQQTHGTAAPALSPPVSTGNVAVLRVDGVTGAVRIYRP